MCKRLDVPALEFTKKIKYRNNKPYLYCCSEDLSDNCSVLNCIFDEMHVEAFDGNVIDKDEELAYFTTLYFSWHMYNGEENTTPLLSAVYKGGHWEFLL